MASFRDIGKRGGPQPRARGFGGKSGGLDEFGNKLILSNLIKLQGEERALGQKPTEEVIKVRGKEEKERRDVEFNFRKVVNLLGNTVGQMKGKFEEQKNIPVPSFGLEGFDVGGPLKGAIGKGAAGLKIPGFEKTGAFVGQRNETTFALNSILTGQNRVIKGVTERIAQTLPDEFETPASMNEKVKQTVFNSFGLFKALQAKGFNKEFFAGLSDDDAENPNSQINQQISQMQFEPLDEAERQQAEEIANSIIQTPARGQDGNNPIPGAPGSRFDEVRKRILGRL